MSDLLTADVHDLRARILHNTPLTDLRDEIVRQARAKWESELAEVKRQAAWDALGEYCESEHSDEETSCRYEKALCSVRRFRDRHYAPAPRSVTLSDGSVVTLVRDSFVRSYSSPAGRRCSTYWNHILTTEDTGTDFDALKAFAASVEAR